MKYYFHHTPGWLKRLYPGLIWNYPTNEPVIHLTFDDGPVPGATPYVLDQLAKFNARGTFFVVGENVHRHPELFRELTNAGHQVGNHTYNHISGWKYSLTEYEQNILDCRQEMEKHMEVNGRPLFRPPYGRMRFQQARSVQKNYTVVMWQILSGDFDMGIQAQSSLKQLRQAVHGDILVFHDSQKYLSNVKKILPVFLREMTDRGVRFEAIKC